MTAANDKVKDRVYFDRVYFTRTAFPLAESQLGIHCHQPLLKPMTWYPSGRGCPPLSTDWSQVVPKNSEGRAGGTPIPLSCHRSQFGLS